MEKIRNIGIIAHIDAGKTTTTEKLLFYTGKIYKMGEVDEGTAVMDWLDQERERGITIFSAVTTCYWRKHKINIIDTPGHVDFTVEVERSLRVLDGAIGIFCGVGGVQPQSETVWRQSDKYKIPRIVYINKMDRVGADFYRVTEDIKDTLGADVVVMQIPVTAKGEFIGIIDVLGKKAFFYPDEKETFAEEREIPQEFESEAERYYQLIVEKAADIDEKIMGKYLHGEKIESEFLKGAIRKGTVECKLFPVFCGSSLKNRGAILLLDAIVDYLPSPVDRGGIEGINPVSGKEEIFRPSEEEKMSAYIFKIFNDLKAGKIFYTRIYSGKIKKGQTVYNPTTNTSERVMRILEVHANKYQEKEEAVAGNIVALTGFKKSYNGNTISEKKHPILLEEAKFPEPVIYIAVEPKVKSDLEKVYTTLLKITDEDPTVKLRTDSETGQVIIMGMGELHIEVIAERLKREHKLNIRLGKPEVAYRETITCSAKGEGKFIKQSGGKGHYGHVVLKIEPLPRGEKFVFDNLANNNDIPKEFTSSMEAGIKEAMESGPLVGAPVMDVKVVVTGGSSHPVDSNEIAYKIAASIAFKDAIKKASHILLEPIMNIEVSIPEEFMGEVLSDLVRRDGKIEHVKTNVGIKIVNGTIPLRSVFGYATVLRSLTQGRGNYIMEPSYYESVPDEQVKKITGI
jgi:elongation factor G